MPHFGTRVEQSLAALDSNAIFPMARLITKGEREIANTAVIPLITYECWSTVLTSLSKSSDFSSRLLRIHTLRLPFTPRMF